MTTYLYKAYDRRGHRKTGTIRVYSAKEAHLQLRTKGLKAYFLEDLAEVKRELRHRNRVRKAILISGAILVAGALLVSGLVVGYASKAPPPDVQAYKEAGILKGGSGNVVADSPEAKRFARDIFDAWQQLAPGIVNGVEVHRGYMTLYVTRAVRQMPGDDLELLATNTVKALQRQSKSFGVTLLVVEGNLTILEAQYNGLSKDTRITRYF